jgi:hypothetical protein
VEKKQGSPRENDGIALICFEPVTRVRFPSPAPFSFNNLHSCAGKMQEDSPFSKLFLRKTSKKFLGVGSCLELRTMKNCARWSFAA